MFYNVYGEVYVGVEYCQSAIHLEDTAERAAWTGGAGGVCDVRLRGEREQGVFVRYEGVGASRGQDFGRTPLCMKGCIIESVSKGDWIPERSVKNG